METIYFTPEELTDEFSKKVIQKGPNLSIDDTKALDLLLHVRFNPEHLPLFSGFLRGLRKSKAFSS